MPEGEMALHPPPFLPASVQARHAYSTSAGLAPRSAASTAAPVPDECCGAAAAPAPATSASMDWNAARALCAEFRCLTQRCPRLHPPHIRTCQPYDCSNMHTHKLRAAYTVLRCCAGLEPAHREKRTNENERESFWTPSERTSQTHTQRIDGATSMGMYAPLAVDTV